MNESHQDNPTADPGRIDLARCIGAAHAIRTDVDPRTIRWDPIVDAACEQWLGGILLEAVERHRWSVAADHRSRLRAQALQIRTNNLLLMRTLADVARALRDYDVDLLLLKGAALNRTLYDRPELRPMSDLDLMVRPEAAVRATAALENAGWRRGPALVRRDFFPRFHYEVEYAADHEDPVCIDLHARPFRPLRYARTVPDDALWQRSHVLDSFDVPVRAACPEDQLIQLATHSACHGQCRLLWLYDIRRLIDQHCGRLDWDHVLHFCRGSGLVLPVRETLSIVEGIWGPVCPADFRRSMQSETVTWPDKLCLAQAPHDAGSPLRHVLVNLLCTPGLGFRAGYLLAMLLPHREHMAQMYRRRHPGWLLCAHLKRLARPALRMMRPAAMLRAVSP